MTCKKKFLINLNIHLPIGPSNPTSRSSRSLDSNWINKFNHIHALENYSTIKGQNDTFNNMNESGKQLCSVEEVILKRHLRNGKVQKNKTIVIGTVVTRGWSEGIGNLGVIKTLSILTVYTFVKTHRTTLKKEEILL